MWIDNQGHINIFGGRGYDAHNRPYPDALSDLWKFDGSQWVWISGDMTRNAFPRYGTLGVASNDTLPGAISCFPHWYVDDTLYLFAGTQSFEMSLRGMEFSENFLG